MNWVTSKIDGNGLKTFYPPQPPYEMLLRCSECGGVTQFLHFYRQALKVVKDDEIVPSFCCAECAAIFCIKKEMSK